MLMRHLAAAGMMLCSFCAFSNQAPEQSMLPTLAEAQQEKLPASAPVPEPTGNNKLTSEKDKLSYTIGADLGANLKAKQVDVDPKLISEGIFDAYEGQPLKLTTQEMAKTMQQLQTKLMAEQAQTKKAEAEKNKQEGEAFLKENKTKEGVVTTKSGLQYKILTPGKGDKPTVEDSVTVEYTGRLIDGTVFDSTDRAGKPVTFGVQDVIPGWTEALQLMAPGAKWEVYVPSDLAYGERGIGGPIGPNKTLIFNIHLHSVTKPEKKQNQENKI